MMRIKEAIQRRKLIQQLNDEYLASQVEPEPHPFVHGRGSKLSSQNGLGPWAVSSTGDLLPAEDAGTASGQRSLTEAAGLDREYISLAQFVGEFNAKLSDGHRRALRVTWNRLSEPPKTSGRGMLKIMEKIFDELINKNPEVKHCFYRSAFLKCLEERKQRSNGAEGRTGSEENGKSWKCQIVGGTIVTIRDHAHLLIELIEGVMCILFDAPLQKPIWDPATIGRAHARLIPFGFDKELWHSLGEVFAEVMFCQECVRAYPLAASAWSMLSVALTDKMFRYTKMPRCSPIASGDWSQQSSLSTVNGTVPNDAAVLSLSADLQQRALISLRGNGQPGSTASSFRRRRAPTVTSQAAVEEGTQRSQSRRVKARGEGQKVNWRSSSVNRRRSSVRRWSLAASAKHKNSVGGLLARGSSSAKRSPSGGGGGRRCAMTPTTTMSAVAVATRANRRLGQTPSFFSRTICSWHGGPGMPSTSLGEQPSSSVRPSAVGEAEVTKTPNIRQS